MMRWHTLPCGLELGCPSAKVMHGFMWWHSVLERHDGCEGGIKVIPIPYGDEYDGSA